MTPPPPGAAPPPDDDEQRLLAELEMLEGVKSERRRASGIAYYIPNPGQYRAHKSNARYILYIGGNRAGKSTFGAAEMSLHLTRQYPDWFSQKRRFKKPVKCVVSATEFPVITRVIEPKLMDFLPRALINKIRRTANGYIQRIEMKDGGSIDFLTSEMKDEAYESADWDFAWMDEPQQKRKYEAILRGLTDRRGIYCMTFTPLTEPWIKDDIVDKADGVLTEVFTVNIRDNKFDIQGNAILNEQSIAELEASYSDDVKDTRISGQFFHLRGVIYKEFCDVHVTDFSYHDPKYETRYPVICVIDPHDRRPHHVIWAYLDPTDDVFVDYEFQAHMELDDLAKKIMEIEKQRGYKMRKRIIDPNFGRKPARVGANLSVIQELHRNKLACYEANDNIELGHLIVRDYLHFQRDKPLTAVNKPKLFFSRERVPKTIRSMRNIQYEEWQGKTKGERDPKETEKDKDTDGADTVRYLLVGKPKYGSINPNKELLNAAPY